MSLLDYGSIEELKRRMQAGAPAPKNASMGAPPPIPPPFLPPNIPAIPRMPEPSPEVYQRAMVSQGPGGLLARPEAPAEYTGLFSKDELAQATPGRVQSLLGRLIGERPQDIMRMNLDDMGARKAQGGEWQDKIAARKDAATLKAQMAALRKKYASGGGDFRNFAAELAMLRPELASQLSGMVNALEPPTPGTPASLQREDNVLGEDGKPYIVYSNPITGKEVRRVRQYVAPQTPRRQLAQIPQADGTVKFVWLTEGQDALGAKSSSAQQLPSVAIEKMIALDDAIAAAEDATNTMATAKTEKANVSGRVGGVLPVPGWVRNQVGQGGEVGRSARSKIGNLTSMIGNLRSGGAITPQEFERLETFLPTPNDDEAVIDGKLKDFTAFLKQMKKTREAAYQKYGKGAPTGVAKPPTQDQADWDAAVALHGKDKVLKEFGPRPEGD